MGEEVLGAGEYRPLPGRVGVGGASSFSGEIAGHVADLKEREKK